MPKPSVLHSPEAEARLIHGFDQLADLLALTLGPTQGVVLSEAETGSNPELLSDAATIGRRVLALPDRGEDVGAMLLRNLIWRMGSTTGDGCATTAVLAQAILKHAHRAKAAGANPMSLKRGIDRAALAAMDALREMARPVRGEEDLIHVAETITAEPDLSLVLGEMFNILGPDAHITIEDYVAPYLEREYQEGGRWRGRLASPYFVNDSAARRAILPACHVALFDGPVTQLRDAQSVLELIAQREPQRVLLVAREIKGVALNTLVTNHQRDNDFEIIAAELRRPASQRTADFEDLGVLTGAEVLALERGRPLHSITGDDLGTARRVETNADELVVVSNETQSARVREQIATLRGRLSASSEDDEEREELRLRIARLTGQAATLKIGASTKAERDVMRQKAEKGMRALPIALQEGVVPGGGIAYLDCIPAVRDVETEGDEAGGVEMLAQALEAPFCRIVENAGVASPGTVLDEVRRLGAGFGYDAVAGETVHMEGAGILDAAGVLRRALQTAVSGAVMALTTEVIVHHRRPETSIEP